MIKKKTNGSPVALKKIWQAKFSIHSVTPKNSNGSPVTPKNKTAPKFLK